MILPEFLHLKRIRSPSKRLSKHLLKVFKEGMIEKGAVGKKSEVAAKRFLKIFRRKRVHQSAIARPTVGVYRVELYQVALLVILPVNFDVFLRSLGLHI